MSKRADGRKNVNSWFTTESKEALEALSIASKRSKTQVLELLVLEAYQKLEGLNEKATLSQIFQNEPPKKK
jgi:hypothetical protein